MHRLLHHLSAFYFYALGVSFFVAYVLLRARVWGAYPALWLQIADVPLLLAALFYGGMSFLQSIRPPGSREVSPAVQALVVIPLTLFFLAYAVFNFSPLWI